MKTYGVKEIFWTIQGEGVNAGRAAMFVRFAGCNLWNGTAERRDDGRGACSEWCDTAFAKGSPMSALEIEREMQMVLVKHHVVTNGPTLCVLTGGEPCLQIDRALVKNLKRSGWQVAVETNGTVANEALALVDHVCVSPKLLTELVVNEGHELKVVLPGACRGFPSGWTEDMLEAFEWGSWGRLYVQPQDPLLSIAVEDTVLHPVHDNETEIDAMRGQYQQNVLRCTEWVRTHPKWSLSMQVHKFIGVP